MNCIYSAHLLSKFLEELRVWIQNPQKWPTDGVIKLLRWELGQMMWSMWYKPVQVLDDERLYFDRDSLKWRSRVASPYITKHHLISKGFHDSKFAISLTWGLEHVEKNHLHFSAGYGQITPKEVPHEFSNPLLFQSNLSGNPVIHQAVLPDFSVADWGDKTQLLQEFIQQWDHVLPSCLVPNNSLVPWIQGNPIDMILRDLHAPFKLRSPKASATQVFGAWVGVKFHCCWGFRRTFIGRWYELIRADSHVFLLPIGNYQLHIKEMLQMILF